MSASKPTASSMYVLGTERETRPVVRPQTAGDTARAAGQRHAARVPRRGAGELVEALLEPPDHLLVGPLLRREHPRAVLRHDPGVAQQDELWAHPGFVQGFDRALPAVGGGASGVARTTSSAPAATAATISSPVPRVEAARRRARARPLA